MPLDEIDLYCSLRRYDRIYALKWAHLSLVSYALLPFSLLTLGFGLTNFVNSGSIQIELESMNNTRSRET